jgi:hypothetical protein
MTTSAAQAAGARFATESERGHLERHSRIVRGDRHRVVRLLYLRKSRGRHFRRLLPETNQTISLLKWLATFAVGFAVRPFGAIFFGRIGDLVGRKYAFMVTLLIMGGSTAAIGFAAPATRRSAFSRRSSS